MQNKAANMNQLKWKSEHVEDNKLMNKTHPVTQKHETEGRQVWCEEFNQRIYMHICLTHGHRQ